MPIYAYECQKCGAHEEHIQKMSDPPVTKCESCGGKLQKQMTAAAFHLKGGGWYADGYGSSKKDAASKSSSNSEGASSSSSGTSGDSATSAD